MAKKKNIGGNCLTGIHAARIAKEKGNVQFYFIQKKGRVTAICEPFAGAWEKKYRE